MNVKDAGDITEIYLVRNERAMLRHVLEAAAAVLDGFEFAVDYSDGSRGKSRLEPGSAFERDSLTLASDLADALGVEP